MKQGFKLLNTYAMLLVLSLYRPHTIIEKNSYQHNITQMYFNQLRETRVLSDDAILTSQSNLVGSKLTHIPPH